MFSVKNYIYYIIAGLSFILFVITADFRSMSSNLLKPEPARILFAILAAAFLISCFAVNSGSISGLKTLARLACYACVFVAFFILAGKRLCSGGLFDRYMLVFLSAGMLLCILSLAMYFTGSGGSSEYSFAAHGIFMHPNTASFMYIIVMPALIYFYKTGKAGLPVFLMAMLVLTAGLLLTFSRAGYIGAFSSVLIFVFLCSKRKALLLTLTLIASVLLINLLMDFITAKQDSSFGRLLLATAALSMIFESQGSFLWGYGVARGLDIFRDEKILFGSYEFVDDPHNFILLLGIQFGMIVALLSAVIPAFIIVRSLLKSKNIFQMADLMRIYLASAVASGLLINNMFEDIIAYPEYYIMPLFLMFTGYIYFKTSSAADGN